MTAVPVAAQERGTTLIGDYIVAVVNQELVTAGEVQLRLARVLENASRGGNARPPGDQVRQQVLDTLIDERVQVTHARDSGQRLDDAELDRAVANVAVQNQITMAQLRERLRAEGIDFTRFRSNVRDQMLTERIREREVLARIRISDAELDAFLEKRNAASRGADQFNIAQILVAVPEDADAPAVAQRRARADAALRRVRDGEAFDAVAREISEDGNRAQGGLIGLRTAERLPDLFVDAVRGMQPGEVSATPLRSGAGFHILKLVERRDGSALRVQQAHARHILLRPSPQLSQEAAARRLALFKRDIINGTKSFEQLARDNSEDGSAAQGGDLGWSSPGSMVPEFEEAMNALAPGGISDPVASRFGVHLIQLIERREIALEPKQVREQARNSLREQKFEEAYLEWMRELRARAYVELREPPLEGSTARAP
ncbi:MAG: peptidylprolyl isomerase [Burkholderiales bacterium]|jgi:peptidyl-prolyl cis-trans isomerase SurA|nr:peptidylprolyl isomerase [Burkholderiales bacterium]